MKYIYALLLSLLSLGAKAQLVYHITFDTSDLYSQQDYLGGVFSYKSFQGRLTIDTTLHNNRWQIGRPHKSVFGSAYSYPNAIVTDTIHPCSANDTSSFTIGFRKELGMVAAITSFSCYYQLKIDSGDTALLEYSMDTGRNWTNIVTDSLYMFYTAGATLRLDTSTSGWDSIVLLPNYGYFFSMRSDSILFRFSLITGNSAIPRDGWMVDEIKVSYYGEAVDDLKENANSVNLFPNPATTELTVKANEKITIIAVSDLLGNSVYRKVCNTDVAHVNIADLPAGIYLVRVNDSVVRKFVKQ